MKQIITLLLLLSGSLDIFSQADSLNSNDSLLLNISVPIYNDNSDDSESQPGQQDISSLLQSSRDVFNQFSGFQFGTARYRARGLTGRSVQVLINGIAMNNPESGIATWSSWGGLNDVMRFPETRSSVAASRQSFSGIGGFALFESRAGIFKKGTRISYSAGNRTYQQRIMAGINSGLMKNGWALSASASFRYGNQVFIPGTYFTGAAIYMSADKKINARQLISVTAFYCPVDQGKSSASTAESFSLSGTPYYNSNWGYQNGKVRNATVNAQHRPVMMLMHQAELNEHSKIQNALCYSFGQNASSGLTWYDAANPDPDYYRYLPSYYYQQGDSMTGDRLNSTWQQQAPQINWDALIAANKNNLYTAPQLLGQGVNTNETRARYVLENKIEKISHLIATSNYNLRKGRYFTTAGLRLEKYDNRKFKQIKDLLGADYWLDVDQFAENLGVEDYIKQNDLDNPNKKIKTGDHFGFDYFIHLKRAEGYFQTEYSGKKIDWFLAGELMYSSVQREGLRANGKFPDNSKGKSSVLQFVNPQIKGGTTLKLNGRQFLNATVLAGSRMPETACMFISPGTRNEVVANCTSEKIFSSELSWHIKYPAFKARLSFYHITQNNLTWLRTYWNDSYNTNVNLIMTGLNQRSDGFELGLEKTIHSSHVLQFAASFGKWVYSDRPILQAWQDNTATPLFTDKKVYLKNYRLGGSPQTVCGGGYRYNARKFWFAGLNFSYLGAFYVEPNPDRRTEEAVQKYSETEINQAIKTLEQEKLNSIFLLNANAGKSIRIKRKYNLTLGLSVNNILNKHEVVSAFESLRWDPANLQKFPNKYSHLQGINFMLNVSLNF